MLSVVGLLYALAKLFLDSESEFARLDAPYAPKAVLAILNGVSVPAVADVIVSPSGRAVFNAGQITFLPYLDKALLTIPATPPQDL